MSQMSPPRLKKPLRMKKIKEMLPYHANYAEIAAACGVNEKTIDRDIQAWYKSGGMEQWLREEFFNLHQEVKAMDGKVPLAYTTIAQLLGKTLTQKVEQKTEGKQTIIVKMWKPDADSGDSDKIPPA
jgi:hypothetical protein